MAYILAVNPRILADSGGPCVVPEGGTIFSPEYEQCLVEIQQQYVTATALASMIGCFMMGFFANLPIALSTGMGLNAYFTYSVVGFRGTGSVSYQAAVTAVLIDGFIMLFLGIVGARYWIVKIIPEPIRIATPAGIGAFLAHIGFQSAEGLGIVVANTATAVTLGACPPENRIPIVAYDALCQQGVCIPGSQYVCQGGVMTSARTWVCDICCTWACNYYVILLVLIYLITVSSFFPLYKSMCWNIHFQLGLVGLFITAVLLSYR
jgi:xanthine/uracil/vitamin C permease (AzgA family)